MQALSASLRAAAAMAPVDDPIPALQSAYLNAVTPGPQADLHRELIASVLARVQRSYAREVDLATVAAAALNVLQALPAGAGDPAETFAKAIGAGLRTLDPYSRYLDARSHGSERDASVGFGGVGLELEGSDGAVRVVAPMPGTPAARAGVLAGDLIVRVDDERLAGLPLPDAMARMRGEPGSPVSLTIRRAGVAQEFTVALRRDTIRRQLLRWSMEGDVLVLKLASFGGPVSAALRQAVADAGALGAPRGVVLDLRGNPGGLLTEAVATADTFLASGEIVTLRSRMASRQRTWHADATELLAGLPMVVLVDRRSASASELVAAALQENGRAKVMGQRSFGKGTVQSVFPLGEQKGALRVTTSVYHGPSGRTVQGSGVVPDIELVTAVPDARTLVEVEGARVPQRLEQAHCAPPAAADAALSCAIGYLKAGDLPL
jgi:carboxyl-terminal processing protease